MYLIGELPKPVGKQKFLPVNSGAVAGQASANRL